jgi:glycosyltransferase involved in cell wall biosynthesis
MKTRRILIIPHSSDTSTRRRLAEVGKILGLRHAVHILNWHEASSRSLPRRAAFALSDYATRLSVREEGGICHVSIPILHRPLGMLSRFNAKSLARAMKQLRIDTLINATHYFFFTPPQSQIAYTHIFDVNDLPTEETSSALGRFIHTFVSHECAKAHYITACSLGLTDYLRREYSCDPLYIPNGVRIHEFNDTAAARAKTLRQKLRLDNKLVIGYIGRLGEWIDTDFLQSFYRNLKKQVPHAALLVVGGGPRLASLRRCASALDDVVCTGPVSEEEVTPYFYLTDIGVIPSFVSTFQDVASHIKLLEFAAAGKPVIASPLAEIVRTHFAHVVTAPCTIAAWNGAFLRARENARNGIATGVAALYDWCLIAEQFEKIIYAHQERL